TAEVNGKHVANGNKEEIAASGDEVDAVQEAIGNLGKWQIFVCLAISLVKFPIAWHQLAIVFMAPHQNYNCTAPARDETSDQCMVNVNGTVTECTEWEYDRSTFTETIISQWNLVCSRTHYANIQQSILMFGVLLGNVIFGNLADRYGRKMPLMVSVVLQLISGIGCAIVPWFPALLLMKLISALATGGTMVTSYVICMEIVGTKWRAAITVLYQIPFSLGHMSLAGLGYFFRHWQHLQIAITLPSIILLSYWWIVPESPRWLLAFGKQRAACKVLQKAANINKIKNKDIPELVRQHCLHQFCCTAEVNGKHVANGNKEEIAASGDEVDAVQEAIGNLGKWQIFVCLAISLVKFPIAWHQLAIVFMAPHQNYNCTAPARDETSDQCMVNVNGTVTECTEWEYDRSTFTETIISQWNLVCSRTHYANIQQSILMFGVLLGNVIFGNLADRYGRKMPLMVSVVLQLISGIGCAIVPWFPALLLMKLISALATGGTMVTSYVICMEIVGTKWRAAITVLYQIPFSLGHMSLAGLGYFFRHWQHLQIAITLPSIILLSYWWIVPESPRWLLAFGKQRAACKVLQKAANINKIKNKDIPELVRQHCLHQVKNKDKLFHSF
ncbi:uncharacterized protein LOC108622018, partial [Ceratina calcarata]|uniref:Uncharacterized protein LOC108622018 n=1 Tax=Ceratina calcarata TaxID=156304 RepID=A0AAJ7W8G1_9HYME